MKKILILFAAVLVGLTASAQSRGGDGRRGGDPRQGMQRMAEHLAKEMKLDDATKSWFVPLYVEYRDTLMALQRSKRIEEKELQKMEDAAVTALIEQSIARDESAVAIKREYLAKFREKLTEKQVYKAMVAGMRPRGGDQQRQRGNGGEDGNGGFPSGGPGGFPGGGPDF